MAILPPPPPIEVQLEHLALLERPGEGFSGEASLKLTQEEIWGVGDWKGVVQSRPQQHLA